MNMSPKQVVGTLMAQKTVPSYTAPAKWQILLIRLNKIKTAKSQRAATLCITNYSLTIYSFIVDFYDKTFLAVIFVM